jgi:cell division GTPase FtsZ
VRTEFSLPFMARRTFQWDDFDAASRVIHEQISPDANVIIGVISDENLGGYLKVTLLTVH